MEFNDEAGSRGLDLPRLYSAVARRKRWVLLPSLAAFLCALAFVSVTKPRYTATAKVMLENGESYFTRPEKATSDGSAIIDDLTVESEAEAAKSPDVERNAMAKLSAEDRAEFSKSSWLPSLSHNVQDEDAARLEAFGKNVSVYSQAKTRVLLFEFVSSDRARAARGANALAQAFLESQQTAKDAEAKSASKWLSEQIDTLRTRVATEEGRVEELRGRSGLLAGASGLAVPSQQLSEITAQIATARGAQAAAAAKASTLRDMVRSGRLDDVASAANDESLRRYAETRVALKTQIAELGRTMLPGHPRMKELAGQLAGLEEEIRSAAMKRVHGYEQEAQIAAAQVVSLQGAVNAQAKMVTSGDADQVKLRELEIDAKTARDQLESYLTKYREAISREAENAAPANGRIIAYALAPASPTFPKTGPTLLLATLAAFFVSLGLVIARILLSDPNGAIVAPRAVASSKPQPISRDREPQLPFGIDPLPAAADKRPSPSTVDAEHRPWAPVVDRFVDRLAETGEGLSLLVTGESPAGALPTALSAARRFARSGSTALLDLGQSPPWLADLFDRAAAPSDGLKGYPSLTARRDLSSALDIYPGAGLAADDLAGVLDALGRDYAFVVAHVADWRDPVCARASEDMVAMMVAASDVGVAEARVRAAYGADGLAIKVIGVGERREVAA